MVKDEIIQQFSDNLASKEPVPGGGGASGVAGALGVSLTLMVISLTLGKKKYAEAEESLKEDRKELQALKERFFALADRDEEVFLPLMRAYAMPKNTVSERRIRTRILNASLKEAAAVPLEVMETAVRALELTRHVAETGSTMAISDAGVAASYLETALTGGSLNVRINLHAMKESEEKEQLAKKMQDLLREGQSLAKTVETIVTGRIEEGK